MVCIVRIGQVNRLEPRLVIEKANKHLFENWKVCSLWLQINEAQNHDLNHVQRFYDFPIVAGHEAKQIRLKLNFDLVQGG